MGSDCSVHGLNLGYSEWKLPQESKNAIPPGWKCRLHVFTTSSWSDVNRVTGSHYNIIKYYKILFKHRHVWYHLKDNFIRNLFINKYPIVFSIFQKLYWFVYKYALKTLENRKKIAKIWYLMSHKVGKNENYHYILT